MARRRRRLVWVSLGFLALLGCAEQYQVESQSVPASPPPVMARAAGRSAAPQEADAASSREEKAGPASAPAVPRRIIYNAQVELLVESASRLAAELGRLVHENGGYIAESDIRSISQEHQRAMWKVRVPVDRFDGFLASVARLGELQSNHIDSQDVTQEYVDLEARIANKQEEEKRLLKHLADSTGKLEDILTVERELSRVRGEVEQMQGRFRYLANVSSLSTVTITANELKNYTPPESPTFATQVRRTFQSSLEQFKALTKAVILFLVALIPWIPLILAAVLVIWWFARRSWRPR